MKKSKRVPPTVLDASDLIGIDTVHMMLKIRGGQLAGILHVNGVDADGMHQDDKERLYYAWTNAEMTCELPRKIVLCDAKTNLSRQKENISYRLQNTESEYCRWLLRRELLWVEEFEKTQRERIGYVMFFDKDPAAISAAMRLYASKLSAAQIKAVPVETSDGLVTVGKALYQPQA